LRWSDSKTHVTDQVKNILDTKEWFERIDRPQVGPASLIVQYSYYMHACLGSFPRFDLDQGKQSKSKYIQWASRGFQLKVKFFLQAFHRIGAQCLFYTLSSMASANTLYLP